MAALGRPRPRRSSSDPALTLRRAEQVDWPALRSLWQELDRTHGELQPGFFRAPPLARAQREFVARLADPTQALLVAERAGVVLGAVRLQVFDTPRSGWARARRRGYLDDLIVAVGARRAGVGERLLAAAIEACRERGADQVVLTVWQGNDAADRIYRRLGFSVVNRALALELDASAAE
ncbi:MAG: GNAT family N-acetyltransferase [Proteobacteria bacterium]|nr:GNAT family N-acetyltransferase [Pseudomonadota bacterium]